MGTEFGVAPRRIRPSLDFGVDKIMRYGVEDKVAHYSCRLEWAQFLCLQAEWAIPRPEWGVSVGLRIWSGNRGVGVGDTEWWCGSGEVVWEWAFL